MNNLKFSITNPEQLCIVITFGKYELSIYHEEDGSYNYEEGAVCITTEGSEYYAFKNLNMKLLRKCVKFFELKKELFFDDN